MMKRMHLSLISQLTFDKQVGSSDGPCLLYRYLKIYIFMLLGAVKSVRMLKWTWMKLKKNLFYSI